MAEFRAASAVKASTTTEQRVGAIRRCARGAASVEDLAHLLMALGLDGDAEELADAVMLDRAAEVEQLQVELAQVYDHVAALVLAVTGRWSAKRPVARQVAGALRDLDRVRAYLESLHEHARAG